ncbi:MAG: FAD-dependent oxidoreductase [Planctomycetota bacterium]
MSDLHYFRPDWIDPSDETLTADVCVYGGTAAGVVAAAKAARLGHHAVLLHPGKFLGGMTTGGLGVTDFGRQHTIGGMARAVYRDIGRLYGVDEEWFFEPSKAQVVIDRLAAEIGGGNVRLCQYLDGVSRDDSNRIEAVHLLGGLTVRARVFVDATYEGDLFGTAGADFTVGREDNAVYGETLNGTQVDIKHQFDPARISPFVVAGDPSSGLLPFVEPGDARRRAGRGDHRVQAYNFRVCMTDDPSLKIDWDRPDGYDPLDHELAVRWLAQAEKAPWNDTLKHPRQTVVGADHAPRKFDVLTHRTADGYGKTDTNNHGPVSSDFIGANYAWPTADYATRERCFQDHVRYQRGLYWTMANDPRVPDEYRRAVAAWGLPRDEFAATGHWPHQLYVREGRRLVADHVVTEHDCRATRVAEDSVGLGSYTMDSHNCSRFVCPTDAGPVVMNEGDVQVPPTEPYPISYRAVIPKRGQGPNLLVPVCFSASHIAFGSARMEPVFMVLAESVACAADLALRGGVAVQDVDYGKLRPMLEDAGQVLAP